MDRTTHGRRFKAAVHRAIEDQGWGPILVQTLGRINSGFYARELVDAVVQKSWDCYDLYDAAALAHVVVLLKTGKIVHQRVPIGCGPAADREVEANHARLANDLPAPFVGDFGGGKADWDGSIRWAEPVAFRRWSAREWETPEPVTVAPGFARLEVGTTAASRTWAHLVDAERAGGGGLARWPYGSDHVQVFAWLGD